jgi:hypothetical protein
LVFDPEGGLSMSDSTLLNLPLPVILKTPQFGAISEKTILGWVEAAKRLGTLFAVPLEKVSAISEEYGPWLLPVVAGDSGSIGDLPRGCRMVELSRGGDPAETVRRLGALNPPVLASVRLSMIEGAADEAARLVDSGVAIIHLEADFQGRGSNDRDNFLKDGIRSVHQKLVDMGVRDNVTLLASGGISMAEHVAKAIICGADGVLLDFPILIALECRMCRRCERNLSCPVDIQDASAQWTAGRVVNLMGAWQNQLLEVMGAMGIRDARRLRGEVGRAMFFDELDPETFDAFGMVEEECEFE